MYWLGRYLDLVTLTLLFCAPVTFDTFCVDIRDLNYKAYNHQTLQSASSQCTDSADTLPWWPWPWPIFWLHWLNTYLDPVTLTYISRSSDFYTFYFDVPLSLGCIIRKVSAEDIAIRGNGTDLEYICPTRHFVYIFLFNPVFQLSTTKNEINLFNNHVLIVAPVTFAPAGAMTPSAEFLSKF